MMAGGKKRYPQSGGGASVGELGTGAGFAVRSCPRSFRFSERSIALVRMTKARLELPCGLCFPSLNALPGLPTPETNPVRVRLSSWEKRDERIRRTHVCRRVDCGHDRCHSGAGDGAMDGSLIRSWQSGHVRRLGPRRDRLQSSVAPFRPAGGATAQFSRAVQDDRYSRSAAEVLRAECANSAANRQPLDLIGVWMRRLGTGTGFACAKLSEVLPSSRALLAQVRMTEKRFGTGTGFAARSCPRSFRVASIRSLRSRMTDFAKLSEVRNLTPFPAGCWV